MHFTKKMDILSFALIALSLLALMFGLGFNASTKYQKDALRDAYTTCMVSHNQISGDLERQCEEALTKANADFGCSQTNRCWLEYGL